MEKIRFTSNGTKTLDRANRFTSKSNLLIIVNISDSANAFLSTFNMDYKDYKSDGAAQAVFSNLISYIYRIDEIIKKKKKKKIEELDFYNRLTTEDLNDLFLELHDIEGEFSIKKDIPTNAKYMIKFKNKFRYYQEYRNFLTFDPSDKYLSIISELNNIKNRLDSFRAYLVYSIIDGYLTIFVGDSNQEKH